MRIYALPLFIYCILISSLVQSNLNAICQTGQAFNICAINTYYPSKQNPPLYPLAGHHSSMETRMTIVDHIEALIAMQMVRANNIIHCRATTSVGWPCAQSFGWTPKIQTRKNTQNRATSTSSFGLACEETDPDAGCRINFYIVSSTQFTSI
jgi:hypothetical protein